MAPALTISHMRQPRQLSTRGATDVELNAVDLLGMTLSGHGAPHPVAAQQFFRSHM